MNIQQREGRPATTDPARTPVAHQPGPAEHCRNAGAEEATCPACGVTMRLWANYYRCRSCGYKESCCF